MRVSSSRSSVLRLTIWLRGAAINLDSTRVSDLSPLAGLKNLKEIGLMSGQQVTIPPALEKSVQRY